MNIALYWAAVKLDLGHDHYAKTALAALTTYANNGESLIAVSIGTIARHIGADYHATSAGLDRVAKLGWLTVDKERRRRPVWNLAPLVEALAASQAREDYAPQGREEAGDGLRANYATSTRPKAAKVYATSTRSAARTKEKDLEREGAQRRAEPARVGDLMAAAASPPDGGDGRSGLSQKRGPRYGIAVGDHPADCPRCAGEGTLLVRDGVNPVYLVACESADLIADLMAKAEAAKKKPPATPAREEYF